MEDFLAEGSILDQQGAYRYRYYDTVPKHQHQPNHSSSKTTTTFYAPPMLPHGDDPLAVPPLHARKKKKKKRPFAEPTTTTTATPAAPEDAMASAATSIPQQQLLRLKKENLPLQLVLPTGDSLLMSSLIPPELAFRAAAAYATLRTLSLHPLRLSPFAVPAFLRALSLPFPNRLWGRIHVALLRILLSNLQMGYHFGSSNNTLPPLDVTKRRKLDGISWPLRAGDNLRCLDATTWPLFYDDYCHLTADTLHASLHDETNYGQIFSMISGGGVGVGDDMHASLERGGNVDDDEEETENACKTRKICSGHRSRRQPKNPMAEFYAIDDGEEEESDPEYQALFEEPTIEDDDDEYFEERPKKQRKRISKKKLLTVSTGAAATADATRKQVSQSSHTSSGNTSIYPPYHHPSNPPYYQHPPPSSPYTTSPSTVSPYGPTAPQYTHPTTLSSYNWDSQRHFYPYSHNPYPSHYHHHHHDLPHYPPPPPYYRPPYSGGHYPQHYPRPSPLGNAATASPPLDNSVRENQHHNYDAFYPSPPKHTSPLPPIHIDDPLATTQHEETVEKFHSPILEVCDLRRGMADAPGSVAAADESTRELSRQKQLSRSTNDTPPQLSASFVGFNKKPSPMAEASMSLVILPVAPSLSTTGRDTISKKPQQLIQYFDVNDETRLPIKKETENSCPNDPANLLKAFIASGPPIKVENEITSSSAKCDNNADTFNQAKELFNDNWPHFRPLRKMRYGVAHHLLSVEDKLIMLEFLLDELLSIDKVAAIFTQRHEYTSQFNYSYAPKPTSQEVKEMFEADSELNGNECGVCGEDGDLICCDGCIGAYHSVCVMYLGTADDTEKWFCPECTLHDPALFGPLTGGRKSSVDWFTAKNVQEAHTQDHVAFTENANALYNGDETTDPEFLVVHGFVFTRTFDTHDGDGKPEALVVPTSCRDLPSTLRSLGSELCSKWPLSQIPIQSTTFSNFNYGAQVSSELYLQLRERFDPSWYENKYRTAPLPYCMSRVKDSHLMDYEVVCAPVATGRLTQSIANDVTNDEHLAATLRENTLLFNPLEMITVFLLKIENDLFKACLLHEFWNTKEINGALEIWSKKVVRCKSVQRLARLLVQLIDAIHPKAFTEGWFYSARVRSKEPEENSRRDAKVSVSDAFTPKDEALRRRWERCQMSNIPRLVAKTSTRLDEWISNVQPNLTSTQARTGKRKTSRGKMRDAPTAGIEYTGSADDSNFLDTEGLDAEKPKSNGFAADELTSNRNDSSRTMDECDVMSKSTRKRRQSDRVHPSCERIHGSLNDKCDLSDSFVLTRIKAQIKRKFSDFEAVWKIPPVTEADWPVAGRKLFDPVGYLPRSTIRYLGRNAGGCVAPFVTYSSLHEVGQVSFTHVWRKRVLRCRSFDELLFLLRVLESFLDDVVRQKIFF